MTGRLTVSAFVEIIGDPAVMVMELPVRMNEGAPGMK